jgi:hypothetical protein
MLRKLLTVVLILLVLVPAMAQESEIELECGQTSVEGAEPGTSYLATCPSDCDAGSIWGTDIYTDDSDICTAAAHAGVITLEEGGTFEIHYIDGIEEHPASEQNDIESSEWGEWSLSFTFDAPAIELSWSDNGQVLEGETGAFGLVYCPPDGEFGTIWGTGVYTDDSSVCTAAVHMDLINVEEGGYFNVSIVDGLESYESSEFNDIESSEWGEWGRSFVVTPEELKIEWTTTGQELPGPVGTSYAVVCPPDGEASSLWGTEIYTDDSSVCTAGVHYGLITLEDGGEFVMTIFDGQESYEASEENGIESAEWGEWERSFFVGL